jgi:hypothetical protein
VVIELPKCPACLYPLGTAGLEEDETWFGFGLIAELQCGHHMCAGCLQRQLQSRDRSCSLCRCRCVNARQRRVTTVPTAAERAARYRSVMSRRGTYETLIYPASVVSTADVAVGTPIAFEEDWRDVGGDARTYQMHSANPSRGYAQCSLHTTRNLFREQGFSVEMLAVHCVDGDIRFPRWHEVPAPLASSNEAVVSFNAQAVNSSLLAHVRLAARVVSGTTHVTALVRDGTTQPPTFRLYDNDSVERSRGTFRRITVQELWTNCTLHAIMRRDCELHDAVATSTAKGRLGCVTWCVMTRRPHALRHVLTVTSAA